MPIFNENDAIAVKETGLMFGDNDSLSAVIASTDLLVILSDVAGLYDKNPQSHSDAKLIPVVRNINSVQGVAGHRRHED